MISKGLRPRLWAIFQKRSKTTKAVSDGGVRAPLYWFHDNGYFEEFLGHKKDLWFHPTGLALNDKIVWSKTAENFGLLHRISIPDIDQSKEGVSKTLH